MSQSKILCVSFDDNVSELRHEALRDAGFAVTSTTATDEAMELLAKATFDLVIIGHRFSKGEKRALAAMAKENCNTPVVLVRGASADIDIPADAYVYALDGTEGVMKAAQSLLAKTKAAAA